MDSPQGSMASVADGSWLVSSTRDKVSTVVWALGPLRWLLCIPETEESLLYHWANLTVFFIHVAEGFTAARDY